MFCIAIICLAFPARVTAADWPTFHGDNTRQGNDTSDPGLANPIAAWTSAVLDGRIYAEPIVVGNQVIAATENNTVYSLDLTSGAIQWSQHLGAPRTQLNGSINCGNIDPLGITATPVADGGNVFVVSNIMDTAPNFHFELDSLNLSTGAVNWRQNIDPPDSFDGGWATVATSMEDRGAITIASTSGGNRVFIPLGGNYGDCGTYHGYVVSYPESGSGTLNYWADTQVAAGNNMGGIWAAGGLSVDASGYVYASTGNSAQSSDGTYDYSDAVIKLDPNNLAPGAPYDYFAPNNSAYTANTWWGDNAGDTDLGSTAPLQLPNNRVFIVGKSGVGYLLNSTSLGHLGGEIYSHQVCNATNDAAFGSLAYANGVAYVPCSDGMAAVQIAGSNNSFSALWYNTTSPADKPPTVAGGLVWAVDSGGGNLDGFSVSSGALMKSFAITGSTHFTTPTAANGFLFVGGGTHIDAFVGSNVNWHRVTCNPISQPIGQPDNACNPGISSSSAGYVNPHPEQQPGTQTTGNPAAGATPVAPGTGISAASPVYAAGVKLASVPAAAGLRAALTASPVRGFAALWLIALVPASVVAVLLRRWALRRTKKSRAA